MAYKKRVPMQVAPEFKERLDKIQKEIMKIEGKKISIRDLTETIAKASEIENIQKFIFGCETENKKSFNDLSLNFDRRTKK